MGTPYDWAIERKSSEMHGYCVVTQDGDIGHLTLSDAMSLKTCHDSDVALITDRAESAEAQLKKAMSLLADDRLELCSHSSHWDDTGQGGRGCPVCIKQRKIQNEIWEFEREVNGR